MNVLFYLIQVFFLLLDAISKELDRLQLVLSHARRFGRHFLVTISPPKDINALCSTSRCVNQSKNRASFASKREVKLMSRFQNFSPSSVEKRDMFVIAFSATMALQNSTFKNTVIFLTTRHVASLDGRTVQCILASRSTSHTL